MSPDWLEKLLDGDRLALSRAITAVENETAEAATVLLAIHPRLGGARVVGFTGAPGVGKSTLVAAYVAELRRRGKSVGVVAVDPSSPLSGGAILGDRVRMGRHGTDAGVFVRSLAARGHLGGLSRTAARVVDVMDAGGKEVVVVETVGAGQSEVEIAELAETRVVVCAPGLGDEVQAIKAGILEIADVLVVNKSDLPLAERTAGQLRAMLELRPPEAGRPPVLETTATTGDGVAALADAIDAHEVPARSSEPVARLRRIVAGIAGRQLKARLEALDDPRLDAVLTALQRGEIDFEAAAEEALSLVLPAPEL